MMYHNIRMNCKYSKNSAMDGKARFDAETIAAVLSLAYHPVIDVP